MCRVLSKKGLFRERFPSLKDGKKGAFVSLRRGGRGLAQVAAHFLHGSSFEEARHGHDRRKRRKGSLPSDLQGGVIGFQVKGMTAKKRH